jgi:hypothetical protein
MRTKLLPAAVVFVLTLPVFSRLVRSWDYPLHIGFALDMARGRSVQPHPLYHACLLALIGGDRPGAAPGVTAVLMAAALAARAWLTAGILARSRPLPASALLVLCLALGVAMPLPNWWHGDPFVGFPSPNAWHSPTAAFAMPFALGLYACATGLMARPHPRLAALTGVAMLFSLLAKPNYVMAFAPCLGPVLLKVLWEAVRKGALRPSAAAGILLLAFGPATVTLAAQASVLRQAHPVFLEPWSVWINYLRDWRKIPVAVLLGTAYPLAVAVCYPRQVNASPPLVLAWGTLGVAIATFASFAEHPRQEGNFGWGMTFADQVLFVACTAFLLRQRPSWRTTFCLAVLGLHVAYGAFYVVRMAFRF